TKLRVFAQHYPVAWAERKLSGISSVIAHLDNLFDRFVQLAMCHAYFPYTLIELVYMAVAISQQEDFAPVSASLVYLSGIVEHSFKGGWMLGAGSAKQSASLHHCR